MQNRADDDLRSSSSGLKIAHVPCLTNISTSGLVEVTEDRCFRRTREAEKPARSDTEGCEMSTTQVFARELGTGHVLQAGLVVVQQCQLVTGVAEKAVVDTWLELEDAMRSINSIAQRPAGDSKMTNIMC